MKPRVSVLQGSEQQDGRSRQDSIVSSQRRTHTKGSESAASGGSSSISIAISAPGTGDVGREGPLPTPPATASVVGRKK